MFKVLDKSGQTITVYDAKEKSGIVYFLIYSRDTNMWTYENANKYFPLYI